MPVLENFAYGDTPDIDGIRKVLEDITQSKGSLFEFCPHAVSRKSDIRLLPLKTLLVYLEMANIISPKYTYFEIYAFKYLIPAQAIIEKFKGERAQFVKTILDNSKTARTWTQIDIDNAVDESGSDRQRVLTALEYFHEKKWIDLQPKSAVEVFEILNSAFDPESTARDLTDLFLEKEKKEISRLHAMVEFFETDQCLAKSLSGYFGERLDNNCRRCSVCMEKKPVKLVSSHVPSLERMHYHALVQPLLDTAGSPVSVTLATRFLCGISSPRLVEYKARQMPGFGRLEVWPYKSVEKWVRLNNI